MPQDWPSWWTRRSAPRSRPATPRPSPMAYAGSWTVLLGTGCNWAAPPAAGPAVTTGIASCPPWLPATTPCPPSPARPPAMPPAPPPTLRPALCISIHDVAPATWADCARLLEALAPLGPLPLTLLVVPDYHRQGAAVPGWYRHAVERRLEMGDELALHGWNHL